jgi:hypothetical protein
MAIGIEGVHEVRGRDAVHVPLSQWIQAFGVGYCEYDYERAGAEDGMGGGWAERC